MGDMRDIANRDPLGLTRHRELMRSIERISSTAALTTKLSGIGSVLADIQRKQALFEPALQMARLDAQLKTSLSVFSQFQNQHATAIQSIAQQSQSWKALLDTAIPKIADIGKLSSIRLSSIANSSLAWESSTRRIFEQASAVGLLGRDLSAATRLFSMGDTFSAFATSTLSRLDSIRDEREAWALETSLRVAEEQLIASTDVADDVIALPEDEEEPAAERPQLIPYRQQEQFLASSSAFEIGDDESLLGSSTAITVCDLARGLLATAKTCNEARKAASGVEIFKPTTRLLEVFVDMPWIMAEDKRSFADFVDCLYFLFYEGAGKDKLRFLVDHGGPLEANDCEFIWCVKHLRNKWTRHDADHGDASAIKKSWQQLSDKFAWLGQQHMPVTADSFRAMQLSLLAKAVEFTDRLLAAVIGK